MQLRERSNLSSLSSHFVQNSTYFLTLRKKKKNLVPINRKQAHSPKMDPHGNWEINMVLTEGTLNLLLRLRNSLQGLPLSSFSVQAEFLPFPDNFKNNTVCFLIISKLYKTAPPSKTEFLN